MHYIHVQYYSSNNILKKKQSIQWREFVFESDMWIVKFNEENICIMSVEDFYIWDDNSSSSNSKSIKGVGLACKCNQ